MDNFVAVTGNLTRDPILKFISSGSAVTEFGVAINTRKNVNGTWEDGDPYFFDVTCWRTLAENVAESLTKGTRVSITGKLTYRQWEADDGAKRSKVEIEADSVAPDLRWAVATVEKQEKS